MSKKASGPDLTKYIDKQLASQSTAQQRASDATQRRSAAPRPFVCRCDAVGLRVAVRTLTVVAWVCVTALLLPLSPLHPVKLNGSRQVTGVLRGFDQFMNLVLEDTIEIVSAEERTNIGMVVRRNRDRQATDDRRAGALDATRAVAATDRGDGWLWARMGGLGVDAARISAHPDHYAAEPSQRTD